MWTAFEGLLIFSSFALWILSAAHNNSELGLASVAVTFLSCIVGLLDLRLRESERRIKELEAEVKRLSTASATRLPSVPGA